MLLAEPIRGVRISFQDAVTASAPWLIPLLLVLILITFVPENVLGLLRTLKDLGCR
jgi:TRAP-type C4-dicarboxylate transport system permease large subunit